MKIFTFFTLFLLLNACHRNGDTRKRQEQIQLLLYLQNNATATSSVQSACFNFATTENACIVSADHQATTCSESELARIKNGIQTSDKRTDSILIAFFSCWKNCALIFNVTNSVCSGAKYPTSKTYRDAQKSSSNTASAGWGSCMTKCNNGDSEETGLKGANATYPTQPF